TVATLHPIPRKVPVFLSASGVAVYVGDGGLPERTGPLFFLHPKHPDPSRPGRHLRRLAKLCHPVPIGRVLGDVHPNCSVDGAVRGGEELDRLFTGLAVGEGDRLEAVLYGPAPDTLGDADGG